MRPQKRGRSQPTEVGKERAVHGLDIKTHYALIGVMGFLIFIRGRPTGKHFKYLLCSEQTTGNRGTQSFGTKKPCQWSVIRASLLRTQTQITDTAFMSAGPPEDVFSGGFFIWSFPAPQSESEGKPDRGIKILYGVSHSPA